MIMEHYLCEADAHHETDGDHLFKQKLSTVSTSTGVSENENSCFECNICLDSAHEPVVTLCGHLYCWACIYKWLNVETSSRDADKQQQNCPVCKANISPTLLVPLYGRGESTSESDSKKRDLGVVVPSRPPPSMLNTSTTSITNPTIHQAPQLHPDIFQLQAESFNNPRLFPHNYGGYAAIESSRLGGVATISSVHPLMGMFGGMVLERIFGSSVTSFMYPASRPLVGVNHRRIRRQEVEIDKSLNRVSIFLFCCLVACLLLF